MQKGLKNRRALPLHMNKSRLIGTHEGATRRGQCYLRVGKGDIRNGTVIKVKTLETPL